MESYGELTIIDGDLMQVSRGIIAHQVNCRGVIGAGVGVSGVICNKYPDVKREYNMICEKYKGDEELFGSVWMVQVTKTLKVANIFSQYKYGNSRKTGIIYTDMDKLVDGLRRIRTKYPDDIIYVPYKIGCGLAGGNWDEFLQKAQNIPNIIVIRPNN
jgi:hypothetical protein